MHTWSAQQFQTPETDAAQEDNFRLQSRDETSITACSPLHTTQPHGSESEERKAGHCALPRRWSYISYFPSAAHTHIPQFSSHQKAFSLNLAVRIPPPFSPVHDRRLRPPMESPIPRDLALRAGVTLYSPRLRPRPGAPPSPWPSTTCARRSRGSAATPPPRWISSWRRRPSTGCGCPGRAWTSSCISTRVCFHGYRTRSRRQIYRHLCARVSEDRTRANNSF